MRHKFTCNGNITKGLTMGIVGVGTLAAGAVLWRAWRNGAWRVGEGIAYQPWRSWP